MSCRAWIDGHHSPPLRKAFKSPSHTLHTSNYQDHLAPISSTKTAPPILHFTTTIYSPHHGFPSHPLKRVDSIEQSSTSEPRMFPHHPSQTLSPIRPTTTSLSSPHSPSPHPLYPDIPTHHRPDTSDNQKLTPPFPPPGPVQRRFPRPQRSRRHAVLLQVLLDRRR